MALQHLRSNTASKRPTAAAMSDGQIAVNTNATSPGLFFKDAGGTVVKVGPVHVGTSAPNSSPAAGGSTGNSVGEQWLDTSGGSYVFKVWDGSAWRSEAGEFVDVAGDTMTGDLTISGADLVMSNGEIIAATGTAVAPSITFTGDTNTGLYSPGADQVALSTSGTGRLFVAANGAIGLNKSNPGKTLDVVGQFRIRSADTDAYALIEYGASATSTNNWHVGSEGDGTFRFYNGLLGAGSERLRITSAGLVGIGTSAPNTLLHVKAASNLTTDLPFTVQNSADSLRLGIGAYGLSNTVGTSQGSDFYYNVGRDHLFQTDGDTKVVIKEGGSVGIGTTSPDRLLEIAGSGGANNVEFRLNATDGGERQITFNGSGSTSQIIRSTGTTDNSLVIIQGPNERARIDSSGNVGIGASTPFTTLSVFKNIVGGNPQTSGSTDSNVFTRLQGGSVGLDFGGTTAGAQWIQPRLISDFSANFGLSLCPNGGNVGIGTTSPSEPLDVMAIANNSRIQLGDSGYANVPAIISRSSTDAGYRNIGYDAFGHRFYVSNAEALRIVSDGKLLVGTSSDSGGALLQVNGNRIRVATAKTPSSASDTGTAGEICWDADYIYVCTATNTWKRAALSTW